MRKNSASNGTVNVIVRATTCVAWLLCLGSAQAQGSAELTANCSECHGQDGIARKAGTPHLNGQPDYLLTDMLSAYQKHKRATQVVAHRDVGTAELPLLAKHYAGQKAERPPRATDVALVTRGEDIYSRRCADCHLDNGRESDKDAPLLAAQELDYLIEQTLAFKQGKRKLPFLMDDAYRDLSEADLTAVAHYFAAQEMQAPGKKKRKR
jgi:cytochrome c553